MHVGERELCEKRLTEIELKKKKNDTNLFRSQRIRIYRIV